MPNQPRIARISQRFSDKPLLFELIPPELDADEQELKLRINKLSELFERSRVDGINLPEIREEQSKSEKGQRKSSFKPRYQPREYAQQLRTHFPNQKIIICRVVVHNPPAVEEEWLIETAENYALENLVVVGGEQEADAYNGLSVPEANRLIRENLNNGKTNLLNNSANPTDYLIGNICIPTRRLSSLDEPERISYKIRCGADFFTTQIITEAGSATKLLEDLDLELGETGTDSPAIFWSFAPIAEKKDINFMRWLGVKIPEALERKILNSKNPVDVSIDESAKVLEKIIQTNQRLNNPCLIGANISFMGMRNFDNAIRLTERLREVL